MELSLDLVLCRLFYFTNSLIVKNNIGCVGWWSSFLSRCFADLQIVKYEVNHIELQDQIICYTDASDF